MAQDSWIGRDKAERFFGSAALAAAGSEQGQRQHLSDRQSQTIGSLFSLSLVAVKEGYGSRPAGSG